MLHNKTNIHKILSKGKYNSESGNQRKSPPRCNYKWSAHGNLPNPNITIRRLEAEYASDPRSNWQNFNKTRKLRNTKRTN